MPNIFNYPFTYESELKLKVGDLVEVPFGKSKKIGVVWLNFEENHNKNFKIKKIRIGFIEFLESSRPRNKVLILFRNDWECYQIFKLYFKFLVHSWFGKYENKLVLEVLIINDNRDLLKRQIHS